MLFLASTAAALLFLTATTQLLLASTAAALLLLAATTLLLLTPTAAALLFLAAARPLGLLPLPPALVDWDKIADQARTRTGRLHLTALAHAAAHLGATTALGAAQGFHLTTLAHASR